MRQTEAFRAWFDGLRDREGRFRIYFQRQGRDSVVLLTGGDKSSQRRDIERAKALARGL